MKNSLNYNQNNILEKTTLYVEYHYLLPTKYATALVQRIYRHPIIFKEFLYFINNGKFVEKERRINILGYTADSLHTDYHFSPLLSYNYLVYLLEEPKDALEELNSYKKKII